MVVDLSAGLAVKSFSSGIGTCGDGNGGVVIGVFVVVGVVKVSVSSRRCGLGPEPWSSCVVCICEWVGCMVAKFL